MLDRVYNIKYFHYQELDSTNQKIYQLAIENADDWSVVWCDRQIHGRGYGLNHWISEPYQNATFSFLLRKPFEAEKDLPILNMWISLKIVEFLTKWQIQAHVKWPNDIWVGRKKISGILIQNKLTGSRVKFTIIGIGINLNQIEFNGISATSIQLENPAVHIVPQEFIKNIMEFFYDEFITFTPMNYDKISQAYNANLLRINQISVFEKEGKKFMGIIRKVTQNGEIIIETENGSLNAFKHKEISLIH
ncbi:MAG: biotin--[acetyl-CoA-carboxylase] ligase [Flavobacteriaceae bacterium]|nr:biotin--[acetyl-CoA-carboxylase] ligase [Flavobacteriaceae bacterium]